MKIVVTGGMGFMGRWLLAEAASQHDLTLLTRNPAPPVFEFLGQQAACRQTDYSLTDLTLALHGADAVVHLAAVRGNPTLPPSAYLPNCSITETLLQACLQVGLQNILLISSRAVYGSRNPIPWTEDQDPLPDTPYGASKLAMEQLADDFTRWHGFKVKCLRLAQLAGWGERSGYALPTFIDIAHRRQTLKVFSSGADGREYLYVRDAARAILSALDHPEVSGVFNIGSESPISILNLARLVNCVFNNEGNLEIGPNASETGDMRWMSSQKARQVLGWSPRWTLEAGLREIRHLMSS